MVRQKPMGFDAAAIVAVLAAVVVGWMMWKAIPRPPASP